MAGMTDLSEGMRRRGESVSPLMGGGKDEDGDAGDGRKEQGIDEQCWVCGMDDEGEGEEDDGGAVRVEETGCQGREGGEGFGGPPKADPQGSGGP